MASTWNTDLLKQAAVEWKEPHLGKGMAMAGVIRSAIDAKVLNSSPTAPREDLLPAAIGDAARRLESIFKDADESDDSERLLSFALADFIASHREVLAGLS